MGESGIGRAKVPSRPVNERNQIAEACHRLSELGLVRETSGNVSVRSGDRVFITPTGGRLADLRAEDVVEIDLDGHHLAGELAPTSELDLHLGVYRRYDAGAVVHTHAPVATALACVIDELPCIHYEMLALGGSIRVAPYATFGTPELAELVLDALEGRTAALMANHGVLVYGGDLEWALRATELLEWAATLYWRAASIGTPRTLGDEQREAVVSAVLSRGYGTTRPA
jgi:L-fuculose-phosphate aldolase